MVESFQSVLSGRMAFTKHPYAAKSGNPIFEDEVSCENEK